MWVIAETTDLPTRYIKEVVTDDRGRYLISDLPKAKYSVWAPLTLPLNPSTSARGASAAIHPRSSSASFPWCGN